MSGLRRVYRLKALNSEEQISLSDLRPGDLFRMEGDEFCEPEAWFLVASEPSQNEMGVWSVMADRVKMQRD